MVESNESSGSIDWHFEAEKVSESPYFKPEAGEYQVALTSDGRQTSFVDKESGESTPQVEFDIDVKNMSIKDSSVKHQSWTVSRSRSEDSVYGQLVRLIKNNGFKPVGVVFSLTVVGKGKGKRYFIPAAQELFKRDKEQGDE